MKLLTTGPGPAARVHARTLQVLLTPLRLLGGRGAGRTALAVARLFPDDDHAVVRPFPDTALRVRLADAYWVRHTFGGRAYEPALHDLLLRLLGAQTVFIDCGANIGWWSVLAASRQPRGRTIAIEPSGVLFGELVANAHLNGNAFDCLRAAVWHTAHETVDLLTDLERHAWGSVAAEISDSLRSRGFLTESVGTVTIDDVVNEYCGDAEVPVVKLDVEGAEVDALRGSSALLERGILVYEDHGRDATASTSRFVIEELGLTVYRCEQNAVLERVGLEDVLADRDPSVGYNLVAVRHAGPGAAHLRERVGCE